MDEGELLVLMKAVVELGGPAVRTRQALSDPQKPVFWVSPVKCNAAFHSDSSAVKRRIGEKEGVLGRLKRERADRLRSLCYLQLEYKN